MSTSSTPSRHKRGLLVATGAVLITALALYATTRQPTLTGFTGDRAETQLACEARFLELPRSESFREHLRTVTAEPHPAGSAAQARVGEYIAGAMERAGLEVTGHPYDVYLPELTDDVEVHIVTPVAMQLSNREPALAEDRFSGHPDLLNGWNAFSGSGDVTGEVVYANYGRREDYLALDEMGVSLAGKVVIARYGGNFRGYKVKFAEERGAAGRHHVQRSGILGTRLLPRRPDDERGDHPARLRPHPPLDRRPAHAIRARAAP